MNDRSIRGRLRVATTRGRRCRGRLEERPTPTVGKTLGRRTHSVNRRFDASCGRGARRRPELVGHRDEPGASGGSLRRGGSRLLQRLPAVGRQLLDPTRRVGADPVEHVAEVRQRIDPQVLARRAQAHQHGQLASGTGSTRSPVFRTSSAALPAQAVDRLEELLPDVWFEIHPQIRRKKMS
jgi:hypothetical protein